MKDENAQPYPVGRWHRSWHHRGALHCVLSGSVHHFDLDLLEATPGIEPGIAVSQFARGRDGWCHRVRPGVVLNSNRRPIGPSGAVPCRQMLASP
jgi:hypothetical protein